MILFLPFRYDRSIGVADYRTSVIEFKTLIGILTFTSEKTIDLHGNFFKLYGAEEAQREGETLEAPPSMAGFC